MLKIKIATKNFDLMVINAILAKTTSINFRTSYAFFENSCLGGCQIPQTLKLKCYGRGIPTLTGHRFIQPNNQVLFLFLWPATPFFRRRFFLLSTLPPLPFFYALPAGRPAGQPACHRLL
jgi:hypothetical protein